MNETGHIIIDNAILPDSPYRLQEGAYAIPEFLQKRPDNLFSCI